MKQVLYNFESDQPKLFDETKNDFADLITNKSELNLTKKVNDKVKNVMTELLEIDVVSNDFSPLQQSQEIIEEPQAITAPIEVQDEPAERTQKINEKLPIVKVIGVGGAGNNIVDYISNIENNIAINANVIFYHLNTDAQHLNYLRTKKNKILIESKLTNGCGTGGDPECGRKAAEDFEAEIRHIVSGADICIVIAGMGKGTGTGAAPVVARVAKEQGILTLGFSTMPSHSEEKKAMDKAISGLKNLSEYVDSLTTIDNQKALFANDLDVPQSINDMYAYPNALIGRAIKAITDIIFMPGYLNIDLADLKNFFSRERYIKSFSTISARFRVEDISQVKHIINEQVNACLFDQQLKDAKSAMVIFYVNKNTPKRLINETLVEINNLVSSPDLNTIYGVINNSDDDLVGFDIISLQDSTSTMSMSLKTGNISGYDAPNVKPLTAKLTEIETPLKSVYGKRKEYIQKLNRESDKEFMKKYQVMENEFDDLIHTKKLDTDGMSEFVNDKVKSFYNSKKINKNESVDIEQFDELNLFKS